MNRLAHDCHLLSYIYGFSEQVASTGSATDRFKITATNASTKLGVQRFGWLGVKERGH